MASVEMEVLGSYNRLEFRTYLNFNDAILREWIVGSMQADFTYLSHTVKGCKELRYAAIVCGSTNNPPDLIDDNCLRVDVYAAQRHMKIMIGSQYNIVTLTSTWI
jgi:hypothetical protein